MSSGMDLLLQAAEQRGGAWDPAPASRPPFARSGSGGSHGSQASLPPKKRMKLARDCGLSVVSADSSSGAGTLGRGGGRTDSSTANSEWMCDFVDGLPSFAAPRPEQVVFVPNKTAKQPVWISPDKWQNILAAVTSAPVSNETAKAKEGKTKANKPGRGRKRKPAPLVKDVDGNDIGMGYFSMNPVTIPEDSPVASPVAEEPTTPVSPPPLDFQDSDAEESSVVATAVPPVSVSAKVDNKGEDDAAMAKKMLYQAYLAALNQPLKGQ